MENIVDMSTQHHPYYAVIFTSVRTKEDKGYDAMSEKMIALAKEQSGFLGIESARNALGITISYWESLDAIAQWKRHAEHLVAQDYGKKIWYRGYTVRICKVEREYMFGEM